MQGQLSYEVDWSMSFAFLHIHRLVYSSAGNHWLLPLTRDQDNDFLGIQSTHLPLQVLFWFHFIALLYVWLVASSSSAHLMNSSQRKRIPDKTPDTTKTSAISEHSRKTSWNSFGNNNILPASAAQQIQRLYLYCLQDSRINIPCRRLVLVLVLPVSSPPCNCRVLIGSNLLLQLSVLNYQNLHTNDLHNTHEAAAW